MCCVSWAFNLLFENRMCTYSTHSSLDVICKDLDIEWFFYFVCCCYYCFDRFSHALHLIQKRTYYFCPVFISFFLLVIVIVLDTLLWNIQTFAYEILCDKDWNILHLYYFFVQFPWLLWFAYLMFSFYLATHSLLVRFNWFSSTAF